MADLWQFRRDTAANWTATNPVLAQGELGLATDTKQFKIGDGTTAWNSLAFAGFVGVASLSGATSIAVVSSLPGTPDANTIYMVTT